jgi:putative heme transporter
MSMRANPPAGLRERKKLKPHRTIQAEALRLFQTQGYEQTTVEQIAEAAETSTTNFLPLLPDQRGRGTRRPLRRPHHSHRRLQARRRAAGRHHRRAPPDRTLNLPLTSHARVQGLVPGYPARKLARPAIALLAVVTFQLLFAGLFPGMLHAPAFHHTLAAVTGYAAASGLLGAVIIGPGSGIVLDYSPWFAACGALLVSAAPWPQAAVGLPGTLTAAGSRGITRGGQCRDRRFRMTGQMAPRADAPSADAAPAAPAPSAARPPRHRQGRKRALSAAAAIAVLAAGVTERSAVAGSVAVLGHLRWAWMPAAIMLEWASMVAFARMLRRLLTAGRSRFRLLPVLATVYAANAVSVSVPLAGPELATAFTFRRITRQGADAPLAGWSLLAGGVASTVAGALVIAGGGLASGNVLAAAVTIPGGVLAVAVLVAFAVAARRPGLRGALERPAVWALRHGSRLVRRPVADPGQVIRVWVGRLSDLRLSPAGWMAVTGSAAVNWLADAGVLAVSILAVGAAVPWPDLLLAYGAGIAAQSFSLTPGGFGVTEGTLSLALVATGMHARQALAAVLLYRLVSFWLVALAGWLILIWLRRPWRRMRDSGGRRG